MPEKQTTKWTVQVPKELDEKFRKTVYETKGMHKGNLTEAIEEAVQCWIDKQKEKLKE